MMTIDPNTTLGQLVDERPGLARELERLGLDYCCGGQRSLAAACDELGLEATEVAEELEAVSGAPREAEWRAMTATQLVDHLVATHHRYLWSEMGRLAALIDKVVAVHSTRHPELVDVAACYGRLREELEPHLLREERVLFPMIRTLDAAEVAPSFPCGSLQNPISVMLRDHDDAGALLAQLRDLTCGYSPPDDACASYTACFEGLAELEADTHLHIHKENNVLFPMVVRLESDRREAHRLELP
jgi:regulator of cell morphogenesis and NO signaling